MAIDDTARYHVTYKRNDEIMHYYKVHAISLPVTLAAIADEGGILTSVIRIDDDTAIRLLAHLPMNVASTIANSAATAQYRY